MKTGRTIEEIAKELLRVAESKRDFIAPCKDISFDALGNKDIHQRISVHLGNGNGGHDFWPTDLFHDQIANKLGIPVRYYERCLIEDPELLRVNVNRWLKKRGGECQMISTLDGKARAFLSDHYRPLDNEDLFEAVYPAVLASGCRIESAELTPTRFYLKAVTDRIQGEVKVGQIVQAGISISNSEIGLGAVRVEPMLFELQCLNGMIVNKMGQYKAHIGRSGEEFGLEGASEFYRDETRAIDDKAFWMKVVDTANAVLQKDGFESVMQKYRSMMENCIEADPTKAVLEVTKKFSLSDHEGGQVLKYLVKGGDLSQYGMINAITRASQDLPDYDRATEFERLGGKVMELPKKDWEAIANAK